MYICKHFLHFSLIQRCWCLSDEPFQSPLPTLGFLSWASSYFFSREILCQHLQHNSQLAFVVLSIRCYLMGCSLWVLQEHFLSGWSLCMWARDWEPRSRSSQLGFFARWKMISLLQFIDVFCGNGISILEHLWQLSAWILLVERSAIEREIVPAEFFFKVLLSSPFSALESGI